MRVYLFVFAFIFGTSVLQAQGGSGDIHDTPELGNFLSSRAGAKVVSCSGTDSTDWMVKNIIDHHKGGAGTWRVKTFNKKTKKQVFPQWVVIELPVVETLSSMLFTTTHITGKYACPKTVQIEFSVESDSTGFERVAYETIQHNKPEVFISLPTTEVRWIKITVLGNWGNPYFMEMGRVYGYNDVSLDNYSMILESEKTLDLHNIYFEKDNTIIRNESLPVIEMLAHVLRTNPEWYIAIEGHTDGDGTDRHNLELSQHRAEAVLDALVMAGVDRERLKAVGKGESQKKVSEEKNEEDKAKNRRVVISLERRAHK